MFLCFSLVLPILRLAFLDLWVEICLLKEFKKFIFISYLRILYNTFLSYSPFLSQLSPDPFPLPSSPNFVSSENPLCRLVFYLFCQLGTGLGLLERGNLPSDWPVVKSVGCFLIMINMGGLNSLWAVHHWVYCPDCIRKQAEHHMKNKPVSVIPPGLCFSSALPFLSGMWFGICKLNNAPPLQPDFGHDL